MPRKNTPEYLKEFYQRSDSGNLKALSKSLYKVATNGIRNLDKNELKEIGRPIIREARKRIRLLEENGLTDSPAYKHIKNNGVPLSLAGDDVNKIKHNILEAFNFLHTKTSVVEGAKSYNEWLDRHLGAETTREQREMIWDLVHRFEESHPGHFINYGYDEAIKRIAKSAKMSDFDKETAYKNFSDYLEGKSNMADLDRDDGQELDRDGASPWFKGRNSMNDF